MKTPEEIYDELIKDFIFISFNEQEKLFILACMNKASTEALDYAIDKFDDKFNTIINEKRD